jgi:hypothetical protein
MNNFDKIKPLYDDISSLLSDIEDINPNLYREYTFILDDSINGFIDLGAEYIENNPQEFEIFLKKLNDIIKILKFIKNKKNIKEIKLSRLIKEVLSEKKTKRDRCLRIADRKYDKPSAYKSGAVVKCRKGMIWKGVKEEINANEAQDDVSSLQTIIDKKRNLGFFALEGINSPGTFWEIVDENNLKSLEVEKNPHDAYIIYRSGFEKEANELKDIANKYGGYLSYKATDDDTRRIGQLLGYKAEDIETFINNKSQLTEAQKETLRTWFKRKGAPGKTGGWVDCNSPIRKDGKITGYKACGRQKGEKRAKYPSCRPTAAKCKSPGKGTKWGKTK